MALFVLFAILGIMSLFHFNMLQDNKYKIFGGCMSPILTRNKWSGEDMFVPCGKCPACINAAASKQSSRVREEILKHKYSVMFTLTYDNDCVPRWELFQDNHDCPQLRPIGRVEQMYNSCPLNYFDKVKGKWHIDFDTFLPPIQNEDNSNTYAVCCKKDIQNFLKRVRARINKLNILSDDKSIRYYIASEYGPQTYRPHYHGVLFFDNEVILREIASIIVQSWGYHERVRGKRNCFRFRPFANISLTKDYIKVCDANTAYYVAEYVSGNLDLPQVLAYKSSRPFHLQSKSPIIGCYKAERNKILENVHRGTYRLGKEIFNERLGQFEHYDIPLNPDLCCSIFRKCKGFSDLAFDAKLQLYSFYGRYYDEWKQDLELSIVSYSYSTHEISETDFLRKFPNMKYRNWLALNHSDEYFSMEMDTDQNWYCSRHATRITQLLDFNKYYPYSDLIYAYVSMFDKYDVLRKSDQLIQFYKLFNDVVEIAGFQSAMLGAYPFMFEHMPLFLHERDYKVNLSNPYVCSFLDEVAWFGDFYTYGRLDYSKVVKNSLFCSVYFDTYSKQQKQRLDKRNKSKKVNNSIVFGSRKID